MPKIFPALAILWISFTISGQGIKIIPRSTLDSIANPQATESSPVTFHSTIADIGTISEDDSPVTARFEWHNTGDKPVAIVDVKTGCSCSQATYVRDAVGPKNSSTIDVIFNPKGHPGAFARKIKILAIAGTERYTAILTIKGTVTPSKRPTHDYHHAMGTLLLKRKEVTVTAGKAAVETIEVMNAGDKPIVLKADKHMLPPYISVASVPDTLEPGAIGDLEISFDPALLVSSKLGKIPIILEGVAASPLQRTIYVTVLQDK